MALSNSAAQVSTVFILGTTPKPLRYARTKRSSLPVRCAIWASEVDVYKRQVSYHASVSLGNLSHVYGTEPCASLQEGPSGAIAVLHRALYRCGPDQRLPNRRKRLLVATATVEERAERSGHGADDARAGHGHHGKIARLGQAGSRLVSVAGIAAVLTTVSDVYKRQILTCSIASGSFFCGLLSCKA